MCIFELMCMRRRSQYLQHTYNVTVSAWNPYLPPNPMRWGLGIKSNSAKPLHVQIGSFVNLVSDLTMETYTGVPVFTEDLWGPLIQETIYLYATTSSTVGVLTEFVYLADDYRKILEYGYPSAG